MDWENFFNKAIAYSFYLLFFLVPLIFSPVSFELFEYPKMMFVYGLTVVITTAWLGKMFVQGRIYIQRTPLDIPLLLYLLSSIFSTIFSIDQHTSLWGYYSRSHGGLMSTICYLLLYYAFVTNSQTQKNKKVKKQVNPRLLDYSITNYSTKCIYILLFSVFFVSLYGILERLGIDKDYWVQDVQNRVFSTLGQPNWLGAMLTAIIFIPISFLIRELQKKNKDKARIIACSLLTTSYFLCLIFTNSKSAILAFWACFVLFIGFNYLFNRKTGKITLSLLVLTLLTYFLLGGKTFSYIKKLPFWLKIFSSQPISVQEVKPGLKYAPRISESSEIRKVVWQGAINIWKHYPLFGSGVETFGYAYYNFRPQEHNLLSEWDFLYNKAHNEFLNILACQGTVGIITYLLLIGSFLFWTFKKIKLSEDKARKQSNYLIMALMAGYISILITNFFGFSVVIIGLLFFLIPAFCFTIIDSGKYPAIDFKLSNSRPAATDHLKRLSYFQITLLSILFLSSLIILYSLFQRFQADYHFNKGEKFYKTDYLLAALPQLQKSVKLSPREAFYHAYLAKTSAKLAAAYYEAPSDGAEATESGELAFQLASLAESEIEQTLQLNKVHLNFYKNKAEVYIFLSYLKPEYKKQAKSALMQAKGLAPTDAKILYNLGLLEEQDKNFLRAIYLWEQAVLLKPNYTRVYLQLAETYLEIGKKEMGKNRLEFILNNIDPELPQAKKMLEKIDNN